MNFIFSILVGALFAGGIYLLMERALLRILLGVAFLGHAANLFIFAMGGFERFAAPIISDDKAQLPFTDPLPAALILTAIVIGMGIQAFLIALIAKTGTSLKTGDADNLSTEGEA